MDFNSLVGTEFSTGKQHWVVARVQPVDSALTVTLSKLEQTGKDAAYYFATKKLRSGKQSKQSAMFFRFKESGDFIKVM